MVGCEWRPDESRKVKRVRDWVVCGLVGGGAWRADYVEGSETTVYIRYEIYMQLLYAGVGDKENRRRERKAHCSSCGVYLPRFGGALSSNPVI